MSSVDLRVPLSGHIPSQKRLTDFTGGFDTRNSEAIATSGADKFRVSLDVVVGARWLVVEAGKWLVVPPPSRADVHEVDVAVGPTVPVGV